MIQLACTFACAATESSHFDIGPVPATSLLFPRSTVQLSEFLLSQRGRVRLSLYHDNNWSFRVYYWLGIPNVGETTSSLVNPTSEYSVPTVALILQPDDLSIQSVQGKSNQGSSLCISSVFDFYFACFFQVLFYFGHHFPMRLGCGACKSWF